MYFFLCATYTNIYTGIAHCEVILTSLPVVNRANTALTAEGPDKGSQRQGEVYKLQPWPGRRESLGPGVADGLAAQVDGHALQELCGEAGAAQEVHHVGGVVVDVYDGVIDRNCGQRAATGPTPSCQHKPKTRGKSDERGMPGAGFKRKSMAAYPPPC